LTSARCRSLLLAALVRVSIHSQGNHRM
jgi:hypothetical protein